MWAGAAASPKRARSQRWPKAYQRPVAPHDCNGPVVWVASIHLMLHIPNALVMEAVRAYFSTWYKDILTDLPRVEGGYIYGLPGPGLGTRLLPDVLTRSGVQVKRIYAVGVQQLGARPINRAIGSRCRKVSIRKRRRMAGASSLRIVDIQAFPTSFPVDPKNSVTLGIGRAVKRDAVIVKVTTEAGHGRLGESHHGRCPGAVAHLVNTTLKQLVVGQDANDVVGVWNKIYVRQLGSHGMGAGACLAMSGIDMALWDIRGKALGVPLYKLLGGASKPIPAYAGGVSLGYQEPARAGGRGAAAGRGRIQSDQAAGGRHADARSRARGGRARGTRR